MGGTHKIAVLGVQAVRLRSGSFLDDSSGNELDSLPWINGTKAHTWLTWSKANDFWLSTS